MNRKRETGYVVSDYNKKPLTHNDYINGLHQVLKARTLSNTTLFHEALICFLKQVHGFDSAMITQNAQLEDEQGRQVMQPNYAYLHELSDNFVLDYEQVSNEGLDGSIDFVLLMKEGTYVDSQNPLLVCRLVDKLVLDVWVDYRIAGEMMCSFQCNGGNSYTTIEMYRTQPSQFYSLESLQHQRQLHSFLFELLRENPNQSFAIYDHHSGEFFADKWFSDLAEHDIKTRIEQSKRLSDSPFIIRMFRIQLPHPSKAVLSIFVVASSHQQSGHAKILRFSNDGVIDYDRKIQICARLYTPSHVAASLTCTHSRLAEVEHCLQTTLSPMQFKNVKAFHDHRSDLKIKQEVLSYEIGKLLSYQLSHG
jgi:hypothetical protein